jgi:hypothetical protein
LDDRTLLGVLAPRASLSAGIKEVMEELLLPPGWLSIPSGALTEQEEQFFLRTRVPYPAPLNPDLILSREELFFSFSLSDFRSRVSPFSKVSNSLSRIKASPFYRDGVIRLGSKSSR